MVFYVHPDNVGRLALHIGILNLQSGLEDRLEQQRNLGHHPHNRSHLHYGVEPFRHSSHVSCHVIQDPHLRTSKQLHYEQNDTLKIQFSPGRRCEEAREWHQTVKNYIIGESVGEFQCGKPRAG